MGFEKACNIKAQVSGKAPDCAVVVATLRGLKANSGLYNFKPGQALPESLFEQDDSALVAGFENLKWHINNVNKYGIPAVVAINRFPQDSEQELQQLAEMIRNLPNNVEVAISEGFAQGGEGAVELAQKVVKQCQQGSRFSPLYRFEQTTEEKMMAVAESGYGAASITLSEKAKQQLAELKQQGFDHLAVLSLIHI